MPTYLLPAFILVRRTETEAAAKAAALDFVGQANDLGQAVLLFLDEALPCAEVTPEPEREDYPFSIVDVIPAAAIRAALPEDT